MSVEMAPSRPNIPPASNSVQQQMVTQQIISESAHAAVESTAGSAADATSSPVSSIGNALAARANQISTMATVGALGAGKTCGLDPLGEVVTSAAKGAVGAVPSGAPTDIVTRILKKCGGSLASLVLPARTKG